MDNTAALQVYQRIRSDIFETLPADRSVVEKYIDAPSFFERLTAMVDNRDFSCSSVLLLCRDLMDGLCEGDPPSDWLGYIYQYALGKSFPRAVTAHLREELDICCEIYLKVLKVVSQFQKLSDDGTWQSRYPLLFLSPAEEDELENPEEYRRFVKAFNDEYIYEMMKLNQEVLGHNTLDHICGVHHIALTIGRQLYRAGLPVDLGRVSGAAAGHDIGKYGCRGSELKKVPYLHYYYTDLWFRKHDITYIRHIALNHSTWDLELENLPLESLILIYADFRVKKKDSCMHIYSLQESFDVVLQKLDNVDTAKEKRYHRVFAKLKDFEDYLVHLGVEVDPDLAALKEYKGAPQSTCYSLLQGQEIINNLKYFSINHNIRLMHRLRDEASLNLILELARSENNWHNLREYLRIFEEYSTYMTQKQKLITLKFLYEQLIHPEEDIRRHSAEIMGALIAAFDEEYRKEVPEGAQLEPPEITSCQLLDRYLKLMLLPDHRIISIHRAWLGHSISIMMASLFSHCSEKQADSFVKLFLKYYSKNYSAGSDIKLYLLKAAVFIPIKGREDSIEVLFHFLVDALNHQNPVLRLSSLQVVRKLLPLAGCRCTLAARLKDILSADSTRSHLPAENFLKLKLAEMLDPDGQLLERYSSFCSQDAEKIPEIFLSNLKTATSWVIKEAQVSLLLEYTLAGSNKDILHTAIHFCNLLKVSAVEEVRTRAGEALIKLVPFLSPDQKNDVAVELLRALEIEDYQFTKYIPYYLGRLILYLPPKEMDEFLDDLAEKIKQRGPRISSLLLKTIGIAVVYYHTYKSRDGIVKDQEKLVRMLGILLNGLANYNLQVRQIAFSVIGKDIFGSKSLNLHQKYSIFRLTAKKILTLIAGTREEEELLFLSNSAGLNHLYRFISDYMFFVGQMELTLPEKIAFFPGTFDPFSLSHKQIAREIRDMGFEVYLAVDEFSWSKRTQPNLIRRNIINMSIADELGIYLFPEELPINIANPEDLKRLSESFPHSDVYIVAGSDVLLYASGYRKEKSRHSVHTFPHILFERKSFLTSQDHSSHLDRIIQEIEGRVIKLSLPEKYEDISSTQIRDYIDQNRDISALVDPLAQRYIYDKGLYRREPQYKTLVQIRSIDIQVIKRITPRLIDEIVSQLFDSSRYVCECLQGLPRKLYPRMVLVRDTGNNNRILGFSAFHWVRSSMLFHHFRDSRVSEHIRDNSTGRIVLIDGIFVRKGVEIPNLEQIILTETLSYCLANDFSYAVFRNILEDYSSDSLHQVLTLQGFREVPYRTQKDPVFTVDMSAPCTLNLDVETLIKEPFKSNPRVKEAVARTRIRLQEALTQLYPGHLVISFDRDILHERLIKKICKENGVPTTVQSPPELGPAVCVPFGKILNKCTVPNTITKSLHTEKMFSPDMKGFKIGPYPYYLDLPIQVRMLRSFNRPVILVDDLLNKGYRIKALDPLLKKEGIQVTKIIVGILSGRGKELMDIQYRKVDSAYFIPKLKAWFNENSMYPFLGGDTLWRGKYPQRNLIPSINLILPYTSPTFISDATNGALFNLSRVCIENAIDLLAALEKEYLALNERPLNLGLLGEVITAPRCPDHGRNMEYDLSLVPSHYLLNDLELLERLEHIIDKK